MSNITAFECSHGSKWVDPVQLLNVYVSVNDKLAMERIDKKPVTSFNCQSIHCKPSAIGKEVIDGSVCRQSHVA